MGTDGCRSGLLEQSLFMAMEPMAGEAVCWCERYAPLSFAFLGSLAFAP